MIILLDKWWERAKFIFLFLVTTFVIYHGVNVLMNWLEPQHRFQEPSGHALKAFVSQEKMGSSVDFKERLRLFYWYGE